MRTSSLNPVSPVNQSSASSGSPDKAVDPNLNKNKLPDNTAESDPPPADGGIEQMMSMTMQNTFMQQFRDAAAEDKKRDAAFIEEMKEEDQRNGVE